MPTSQSSTDTDKRRPRGDMYLRAEQRHQVEAAAARLTEILTPTVPGVYDQAPDGTPPPAFETLATTTSVASSPDGLVAAAPNTAVVDLSFMMTPAQIAGTITPPVDAPVAPASVALAPTAEWNTTPVSVPLAPTVEAPVPPPGIPIAPAVASLVAPASTAIAPTVTLPLAPVRAAQRRRRRASLVPASVFGAITLAALVGIASMFWLRPTDAPAQSATLAAVPTATVQKSAPATTGEPRADANSTVPVTPSPIAGPAPPIAGPASRGPAYGVVTNSAGNVEPPGRPGLAQQARQQTLAQQGRQQSLTEQAGRPGLAEQARRDATPSRPAAVTPIHTASEGELRITSTPSGARVTVNGIGWGKTPLTLAHLSLGQKTVRVTQDGYASQQRSVELRGDTASASVHLALRRAE